MWGLEYALLFGAPENKLELLDGQTPLSFPFPDRDMAEAHFAEWTETLCRWHGVAQPPRVEQTAECRKVELNNFVLRLFARPISLRVPFDGDAFLEIHKSFWRRDLWEGQPPGHETGWDSALDYGDVELNLRRLFAEICRQHGGVESGRVAIALSDTVAVEPDQYYFAVSRQECMIERDYFHGVPHIVAQVLSPATRSLDRGRRKEVFRRAGVAHFWLVDPLVEQVELHELTGGEYRLVAIYHAPDDFRIPSFPDMTVRVADLFDTQTKRFIEWRRRDGQSELEEELEEEPEPAPPWLISRDTRMGLAYLMVLGHPERRFEIWDNRAPCVLAFGSDEEARFRFGHFLEDICRWERSPLVRACNMGPSVDVAEAGRFQLTRRGRHVWLDVAVDARKYRELLEVSARRDSWDWGDRP